jgi:hypothetical protein
MFDDKPVHDVADQQRPARSDLEELAAEEIEIDTAVEADHADVVDQHRIAPVLRDDEPWP